MRNPLQLVSRCRFVSKVKPPIASRGATPYRLLHPCITYVDNTSMLALRPVFRILKPVYCGIQDLGMYHHGQKRMRLMWLGNLKMTNSDQQSSPFEANWRFPAFSFILGILEQFHWSLIQWRILKNLLAGSSQSIYHHQFNNHLLRGKPGCDWWGGWWFGESQVGWSKGLTLRFWYWMMWNDFECRH